MDRSISIMSARLDDVTFEEKLARMRDASGRTVAEHQTALALASKLERRRREQQLNS